MIKHGTGNTANIPCKALYYVIAAAEAFGLMAAEPFESPVKGGDEKTEYLIHLK